MPNKHTEHYAVSSAQHSAAANGVERHSSQPFLTEQQRAALDAALAAKQSAPGDCLAACPCASLQTRIEVTDLRHALASLATRILCGQPLLLSLMYLMAA